MFRVAQGLKWLVAITALCVAGIACQGQVTEQPTAEVKAPEFNNSANMKVEGRKKCMEELFDDLMKAKLGNNQRFEELTKSPANTYGYGAKEIIDQLAEGNGGSQRDVGEEGLGYYRFGQYMDNDGTTMDMVVVIEDGACKCMKDSPLDFNWRLGLDSKNRQALQLEISKTRQQEDRVGHTQPAPSLTDRPSVVFSRDYNVVMITLKGISCSQGLEIRYDEGDRGMEGNTGKAERGSFEIDLGSGDFRGLTVW